MLSETEKDKIRLEEAYRTEVRKQNEDSNGNILKFLNSPFGLLLTSSVLISFLSWSISMIVINVEENREAKEASEKLRQELVFRSEQFVDQIQSEIPFNAEFAADSERNRDFVYDSFQKWLVAPDEVPSRLYLEFHPEFKNYTVYSLLSQLSVNSCESKEKIMKIRRYVQELDESLTKSASINASRMIKEFELNFKNQLERNED